MNNVKIYLNSGLSNEIEMTRANGYITTLPLNAMFRLDETLDEANFEFYSSIEENIKPFTRFKIVKEQTNNTETNYYYGYSEVEKINLKKGIYKHYVYLIEPTKILERHILGARYFSKDSSYFTTYKDLVDLILETCYTTCTKISETSPIDNFYFDDESDDRLLETAREFQFSDTTTLFEALEEIALSINAYPRVIDFDKIVFDFFEDGEDKTIDSQKIFNEKTSQDMNRYSTSLFSTIKNVISNNELSDVSFPNPSSTMNPSYGMAERTEVVRLTEDTAFIQTEYPIYKIKKVIMCAGEQDNTADGDGFINNGLRFKTSSVGVGQDYLLKEMDITNYVVEKKQWELFNDDIDTADAWKTVYDPIENELTGENSKFCSLYFEEGDNKIQNLYKFTKFGFLGLGTGEFSLFNITTVISKLEDPNSLQTTGFADGVTPMFKIVYETIGDYTIKQYRNKYEDFGDEENSIVYNQGGNLIDFELFGENIKGKIKRMGNQRYEVAFIATDYVNVSLGDKINDYVITEINKETYRKYEKILLKLDKNFNRKSNDVSIESQKRLFSIPSDDFAVERKINVQRFITFSETQDIQLNDIPETTKEFLARQFTSKGKESGVLYDLPLNNQKIDYIVHTGFDTSTNQLSTSYLSTPIILQSENAFSLNFGFDDIREMYPSIKKKASMSASQNRLKTERTMQFYSDENGEVEIFKVAVFDELVNFLDSQADFAYNFPKVDIEFLLKLNYRIFEGDYKIKKDAREKLSFNLQFNFLSNSKDIIVTNKMVKNNILFRGKSGQLYGVVRIQPLINKQNENYLTYDTAKGEAESLIGGETTSGFSCIYNKDERKLEIIVPQTWKDTKEGFAFIDSQDNVIMIVNDTDVDNIFINYSNKY